MDWKKGVDVKKVQDLLKKEFNADNMIQESINKIKKIKSNTSCNDIFLNEISTSEHLEQMFIGTHNSEKD